MTLKNDVSYQNGWLPKKNTKHKQEYDYNGRDYEGGLLYMRFKMNPS
jgi:hypothetical protein